MKHLSILNTSPKESLETKLQQVTHFKNHMKTKAILPYVNIYYLCKYNISHNLKHHFMGINFYSR